LSSAGKKSQDDAHLLKGVKREMIKEKGDNNKGEAQYSYQPFIDPRK
jgi:hypothetical protein